MFEVAVLFTSSLYRIAIGATMIFFLTFLKQIVLQSEDTRAQ